jgi:hypothetical protein
MKTLANTADREEMRERLLALSCEDEAQWGVMSAGQMICHVRGAFQTAMAEGELTYEKTPLPPGVIKKIALYAPVTWAKNFPTMASLRIGAPALQTADFEADRAGLVEALIASVKVPTTRATTPFFTR